MNLLNAYEKEEIMYYRNKYINREVIKNSIVEGLVTFSLPQKKV